MTNEEYYGFVAEELQKRIEKAQLSRIKLYYEKGKGILFFAQCDIFKERNFNLPIDTSFSEALKIILKAEQIGNKKWKAYGKKACDNIARFLLTEGAEVIIEIGHTNRESNIRIPKVQAAGKNIFMQEPLFSQEYCSDINQFIVPKEMPKLYAEAVYAVLPDALFSLGNIVQGYGANTKILTKQDQSIKTLGV